MLLSNPNLFASLERAKRSELQRLISKMQGARELRVASRLQAEQRRAALFRQIGDPLVANVRLERIMEGNDLTDISYLAQGAICARSVGRVVIRQGERVAGFGTGFLVAPGVLLTNRHVLPRLSDVQASLVQFNYERSWTGRNLPEVEFRFLTTPAPIIDEALDLALVAVAPRSVTGVPIDTYGWLKLNPQPGKAIVGEYLTVIQHPNGERKQICVRENKLLKYEENSPYLWYQTDTVPGSSGSPAFNNSWEVVALHHSSVPKTRTVRGKDVWLTTDDKVWTPEMGDEKIGWLANEGVRISRILEFLGSEHRQSPLTQSVLTAPPSTSAEQASPSGPSGYQVESDGQGITRILVPVEIGIRVGVEGRNGSVVPGHQPPRDDVDSEVPPPTRPTEVEAVVVDQTNYSKRKGFSPTFIKGFTVPLPKLTAKAAKFGKSAVVSGQKTELKYYNYSLVLNADRQLAYFSAANIAADQFRGERDKAGDRWYRDTRIDAKFQLDDAFYGKQKTFEADRTLNPFDRGHLTRRSDLQWGSDDEEAKRNGDESFHWTNCSPQHWRFNQNSKGAGIWFRLESDALANLSVGKRLCLFNGPVFDAPSSVEGSDGKLRLNLHGKSEPDAVFGGVKIPKLFFKVICYASAGELQARAFVVTQEDLIATIDRLVSEKAAAVLTNLEIRLYQVRLTDLEKLTGLDFGDLGASDTLAEEAALATGEARPIATPEDVIF